MLKAALSSNGQARRFDKSIMKSLFTITSLLLLTSCATMRQPELKSRHTHRDPQQVKDTLSVIKIPEVRFENTLLPRCAIVYWAAATKEMDPQHSGISHIFTEGAAPGPFLDLVATNISSLGLLNEICRQANLVWWITPKCIIIKPRNEMDVEQPVAPLPKESAETANPFGG